MTLIDTNVVLRWLLNDHPVQSARARAIFAAAGDKELLVTDVVLAEIAYVLQSFRYDNQQIVQAFRGLEEQSVVSFEPATPYSLLTIIIGETQLDFADCYLIARALYENQPLETFDKTMLKAYKQYKTAK